MIYLQIFIIFFKIGLFGFGGGYAIISLIQNEMISHEWLTQSELTDIIAISQMTPGPIAINCATYTGYVASGNIFGAIIATFAVILPSLIIMFILIKFLIYFAGNKYYEFCLLGLRPTVIGLIGAAILFLLNSENFIDYKSFIIFGGTSLFLFFTKIHPALIIILAGIVGIIIY
ncbi:MAG: chromate transporter [Bacteroidales bacterium]|jgi:chromate transporter|nr:chromate transporter [Bacteroidales bacterium]